jgi:hypothetical protein
MLGPQADLGAKEKAGAPGIELKTWGHGSERSKTWGGKLLRGLKLDNLRKVVLYGDVSAQERACDEFRDIERAVGVDEDEGEGSTGDEKEADSAGEAAKKKKKKKKKKRANKKKRRSVGHALSALRSALNRVGKALCKALATLWARAVVMLSAYLPKELGDGARGKRGGYMPAPFIR